MKNLIFTLLFLLAILNTTTVHAQQYNPHSTGEISVSDLTPTQLEFYNQRYDEDRELYGTGHFCFGIYDDSGTYCRENGIISDYNVVGRRWYVVYDCTLGIIYWFDEIP